MYSCYCKNKINIRYNLRFISASNLEKFNDFIISKKISVNEIFIKIDNKLTQIHDNEHFRSIIDDMLSEDDIEIDDNNENDMAQVMFPTAKAK